MRTPVLDNRWKAQISEGRCASTLESELEDSVSKDVPVSIANSSSSDSDLDLQSEAKMLNELEALEKDSGKQSKGKKRKKKWKLLLHTQDPSDEGSEYIPKYPKKGDSASIVD